MPPYIHHTVVRMYDTDAAGIIYFASQFRFAHDAFESVMALSGKGFRDLIENESYMFVIVHAESDFKAPMRLGDKIAVKTIVSHIGHTSFSMAYEITNQDGVVTGTTKTIHVALDKATWKKRELPDDVKAFLRKFENP